MRANTGPAARHACWASVVQGQVCKSLGQEKIKPHKVRYHLENRDAEFEQKMAEVLCVYREVQILKKASAKGKRRVEPVTIVSCDEKPIIQAFATTTPDLLSASGSTPPLRATMNTNAMVHSACWLESICSPAKANAVVKVSPQLRVH